MPTYCFACDANSKNNPVLSYFRFPREESRCALWFKAMQFERLEKQTSDYCFNNLRLCSNHFENNMFSGPSRNRLHIDAVPTVFNDYCDLAGKTKVNDKPPPTYVLPSVLPGHLTLENALILPSNSNVSTDTQLSLSSDTPALTKQPLKSQVRKLTRSLEKSEHRELSAEEVGIYFQKICSPEMAHFIQIQIDLLKDKPKGESLKNFGSLCKFSSQDIMAKKALVFLGPGAEEMEFVISVDVLRRGGIEVVVAGLPDESLVKCSRDVYIKPDIGLSQAAAKSPFDVIVLPGGLGGSKAMAESKEVGKLLAEQEKAGRIIAAICAAPTALKAHNIGVGKTITSYPVMKAQLEDGGLYKYTEDKVVVDGNLITSRGPGTAFDFALTIVDKVVGKEKAVEVAKGMLLCYS